MRAWLVDDLISEEGVRGERGKVLRNNKSIRKVSTIPNCLVNKLNPKVNSTFIQQIVYS